MKVAKLLILAACLTSPAFAKEKASKKNKTAVIKTDKVKKEKVQRTSDFAFNEIGKDSNDKSFFSPHSMIFMMDNEGIENGTMMFGSTVSIRVNKDGTKTVIIQKQEGEMPPSFKANKRSIYLTKDNQGNTVILTKRPINSQAE